MHPPGDARFPQGEAGVARVELEFEEGTGRDEGVLPRRPVEAAGPEGGEPARGVHRVFRGGERGRR